MNRRCVIHDQAVRMLRHLCGIILVVSFALAAHGAPATQPVNFGREIAPILLSQCQVCHGPEQGKGNYRLGTSDRPNTGGGGKATPVVAGKPDASEIYKRITAEDE